MNWHVNSQLFAPFWFNPLEFEWENTSDDFNVWLRWMRRHGTTTADKSWDVSLYSILIFFSSLLKSVQKLKFTAIFRYGGLKKAVI